MALRLSIKGCLANAIGKAGVSEARLNFWLEKQGPRLRALAEQAANRSFPHFRILHQAQDIEEASAALSALSAGAETLVVLGTGGSSLGGQALAQLGGWNIPGDNGPNGGKGPRLRFYDNLDARSFARALASLDMASTRFIVISKSGTTAETLAQTLTAFEYIEAKGLGALIPKLFLGLTEPERPGVRNGLRELFGRRGISLLPHEVDIGGRYSAFSNVGLLPALARGLDVKALRAGGLSVLNELQEAVARGELGAIPSAVGAAVAVGLAKDQGVTCSVLMPYCDRLERFAAWYVQLWAESLGKNGQGTTPIAALGPVDQHSQLQLFMDGPNVHLMTIVRVLAPEDETMPIGTALAEEAGAPYLAGRTMGDLVRAQQQAIVDSLIKTGRPVRTLDIDVLDETAMGELMMHFMLETILAAELLGVDPFDQPAVELGKTLTRQYLAR